MSCTFGINQSPHLFSPTKQPNSVTVLVFRNVPPLHCTWFPHIWTQRGMCCVAWSIARKTSFAVCVVSSWTTMWIIRVNLKGQVQSLGILGHLKRFWFSLFTRFLVLYFIVLAATLLCFALICRRLLVAFLEPHLKCRSLHSQSMSWARGRHSLEQRKTTCCRRDINIHKWS